MLILHFCWYSAALAGVDFNVVIVADVVILAAAGNVVADAVVAVGVGLVIAAASAEVY